MRWPRGEAEIEELLRGQLQQVTGTETDGQPFLDKARRVLHHCTPGRQRRRHPDRCSLPSAADRRALGPVSSARSGGLKPLPERVNQRLGSPTRAERESRHR
jgi:hypothetical protein